MPNETERGSVTKESVRALLRALIEDIMGIEAGKISDDFRLGEEIKFDSLEFVTLQSELEAHYKIQLDPVQMILLENFADVADHIYELANEKEGER